MKTIELINKKFEIKEIWGEDIHIYDKEADDYVKSFYTQQILSLIEELEGNVIGEDEKLIKDKKEMVKIFKLPMRNFMEEADVTFMLLTENSKRKNRNQLRDQMRASIREFFEIKD